MKNDVQCWQTYDMCAKGDTPCRAVLTYDQAPRLSGILGPLQNSLRKGGHALRPRYYPLLLLLSLHNFLCSSPVFPPLCHWASWHHGKPWLAREKGGVCHYCTACLWELDWRMAKCALNTLTLQHPLCLPPEGRLDIQPQ